MLHIIIVLSIVMKNALNAEYHSVACIYATNPFTECIYAEYNCTGCNYAEWRCAERRLAHLTLTYYGKKSFCNF
jgi:hypothetical protein